MLESREAEAVEELLADTPGVAWSLSVRNCTTGNEFLSYRGDSTQRTASIGKLLLLIEAARQVESGALPEHELLQRTNDDRVRDSGLWQFLDADALSVHDACVLIGRVSDNLATNVLLRRVGLAQVERLSGQLGFRTIRLHDMVRDVRTPMDPQTLSTGSAAELSSLMHRLATNSLVSPQVSRRVVKWIRGGADLSMVASGWGLDPLTHSGAEEAIRLAHKTGTDTGVRGDVGIGEGPCGTVAYAALAQWDGPGVNVLGVLAAMRRIGEFLLTSIAQEGGAGR